MHLEYFSTPAMQSSDILEKFVSLQEIEEAFVLIKSWMNFLIEYIVGVFQVAKLYLVNDLVTETKAI